MADFYSKTTFINSDVLYRKKFENRNIKSITQYSTPKFNQITERDLESIKFFNYAWARGDNWQYIADKFYDSPKDWKILALFNKKPTECHISIGDIIMLPRSLEELKNTIG